MIAIVADDFEQASAYLGVAGSTLDGQRYVVVTRPEHLQGALTGAAYLGGSPELRQRVQELLEHGADAATPGA